MLLGPLGDHRNNLRDSQLSAFFNCPLHAIEFEDGKNQGDVGGRYSIELLAKLKFNAIVSDTDNPSVPDVVTSRDIKVLSDLSTKNTNHMIRMSANEGSTVPEDFISDPTAACHNQDSDTTLWHAGIESLQFMKLRGHAL
jgi:hypothetical protein